jgi:hypothetical protein
MAKIQYTDKVTFTSSQLPEINKCTAPNLNEIKESVNWLYDNVIPEPEPSNPVPVTTVLLATVGNLSYNPIYNNGVNGVGATLTATANGVLRDTSGVGLIDGSSDFENGDSVLIKNRPNQEENGIFTIIDKGSPSTQYQLERTAEYNEGAELFPLQVNVILGNTNGDKIFLQQTENVEIGVSDIIFVQANSASTFAQIRFVDTATSEPMPAFTYNPTTKIFTADAVGYLGTINGLFATTNPNIEGGFTRFLVKDETESEYNGTMQILNTGSSTTYAQWVRVDTSATEFTYRQRTFIVSKVGSTLYSKQYFVQPNTPVLTTSQINTASINFVESNTPTLQNVSDVGGLDNGSTIRKGSKDNYGFGGGISQVCSLEKELQWENGVQYYFVVGQPIVHANSINNDTPDSSYDNTKGFAVSSRYTVLNNGKTYICIDATTDSAVWLPMGGQYTSTVTSVGGVASDVNLIKAFYSINNGIVDVTIYGRIGLNFSLGTDGGFDFTLPIPAVDDIVYGNISIRDPRQFNGILRGGSAQFFSSDSSFITTGVDFVAKFTYQAY